MKDLNASIERTRPFIRAPAVLIPIYEEAPTTALIFGNTKYAITPSATGTGPHLNANLSLPTRATTLITRGAITT